MGLALFVLLERAPFWLPSFLAWYWILRGGRRARIVAVLLWIPALLAGLVGPLAPEGRGEDVAVMAAVGSLLGALMGAWQRRLARQG